MDKKGKTSIRIMQEVLNIYAENDYEKMTLALIAKNIGIKKPSIYSHFSNKQELFLSLIDDQFKKINYFLDNQILTISSITKDILYWEIFKKIIIYITKDPVNKKFWHKIFFNPPIDLKENIKIKVEKFAEKFMSNMIDKFILNNSEDNLSSEMKQIIIDSFIAYIFGIISLMIYDERLITIDKLEVFWNIFYDGLKAKLK